MIFIVAGILLILAPKWVAGGALVLYGFYKAL